MSAHRETLLAAFESGEIDPTGFDHRAHVQVAWEMLRSTDYVSACARYARGIEALAERAGAPDKFNVTITFAFLSLIAERVFDDRDDDFERFYARHAQALAPSALSSRYSREALASPFARTHFLLPA